MNSTPLRHGANGERAAEEAGAGLGLQRREAGGEDAQRGLPTVGVPPHQLGIGADVPREVERVAARAEHRRGRRQEPEDRRRPAVGARDELVGAPGRDEDRAVGDEELGRAAVAEGQGPDPRRSGGGPVGANERRSAVTLGAGQEPTAERGDRPLRAAVVGQQGVVLGVERPEFRRACRQAEAIGRVREGERVVPAGVANRHRATVPRVQHAIDLPEQGRRVVTDERDRWRRADDDLHGLAHRAARVEPEDLPQPTGQRAIARVLAGVEGADAASPRHQRERRLGEAGRRERRPRRSDGRHAQAGLGAVGAHEARRVHAAPAGEEELAIGHPGPQSVAFQEAGRSPDGGGGRALRPEEVRCHDERVGRGHVDLRGRRGEVPARPIERLGPRAAADEHRHHHRAKALHGRPREGEEGERLSDSRSRRRRRAPRPGHRRCA